LKKILITGAGGFIGQALCDRFAKTKNDVTIIIRKHKKNNFKYTQIIGDLKNEKLISNLKNYDTVIHLAAFVDVKDSFKNVEKVYKINVEPTFNILKKISSVKKKPHFIYLSSSVVFGNTNKIPIDESFPLNPTSPYAMSKACCEMLCRGFSNAYDIPITILRPFSVYGPNAPHHQLIPRLINQLKNQKKLVQNNPLEIRDFVYIDDVADAIFKSSNYKPKGLKIYNVGSGKKISIMELINQVLKLYPHGIILKKGKISELNKKKSLADISLIKKELKWIPETSIQKGLKKVIAKENLL